MGAREEFKGEALKSFKLLCEFEIKGLPKTINQMGRKHWAVKANEARLWTRLVMTYCIVNKIQDLNLKQARLEFVRHSSHECDFDNLASSFKHVLDGLVRAKVIHDDKPSVISSPLFKWEKAKIKEGKITVRLFVLEEDLDKIF